MDLGVALNNLANKIAGGNSGSGKTEGLVATDGTNASGGASSTQLERALETAIGDKLAGSGHEAESAKTIEEKASAAIDDLMEKLGLSGSEKEEEKSLLEAEKFDKSGIDKEALLEKLKENPNSIDINSLPEDIKEAFEKFKEEWDEKTFSKKEETDFINGEKEINERLQEAIKNNPDADPAEMEKEIREAYAFENPAHAEAKAEVDAENEKHDAAHKEASDSYVNENPVPEMESFESVEEFNKAMDEWQDNYKSHMADFEKQYREDNPKYEDTKRAEMKANILSQIGTKVPIINDPGIRPIDPSIIGDIEFPEIERDPMAIIKEGDLPQINNIILDKDTKEEDIDVPDIKY